MRWHLGGMFSHLLLRPPPPAGGFQVRFRNQATGVLVLQHHAAVIDDPHFFNLQMGAAISIWVIITTCMVG